MKRITKISVVLWCTLITSVVGAQDLDPRAYVRAPINGTFLISGLGFSKGGVITDPTLPFDDVKATVGTASIGVARTFGLFGQTAQALVVVPYASIKATGTIDGETQSAERLGFADMRFRCSVLLLGGKAAKLSEFKKAERETILGTSISVVIPTGEYFSDKLVNIGTSRWAFKPEVGLSQPIDNRWLIDVYAGVWFFTTNHEFYPGSSVRTQDVMASFQTHLSYNINPKTWVALNMTYYTGGQTTVNDIYKDDRSENSRIGCTLALPVGKRNSLKIAFSSGAIIRVGANFSTLTVGWSTAWFD